MYTGRGSGHVICVAEQSLQILPVDSFDKMNPHKM